MYEPHCALTEVQLATVAEAIARLSSAFLNDVNEQIDWVLQPAVVRGVCGAVLGAMVASGTDPDAIDQAVALARGIANGDLLDPAVNLPEPHSVPRGGASPIA